MKIKRLIIGVLIFISSPWIAHLVYQLTDDKLNPSTQIWIRETSVVPLGTFSSLPSFKIPDDVQKNEEVCESVTPRQSTDSKVRGFLSTWEAWEVENKKVIQKTLELMTQKKHQFSNMGLSFFQQEFQKFYKSVEVFEYTLCAMRLRGQRAEADGLSGQFILNLLSQLKNIQPANYQLWSLQTLQIYLNEEKVFTQNDKIKESIVAQISALSEETLFIRAKKFSSQMVMSSLQNLKAKGWLDLKIWLPAMLIHENKLFNQMVNYEMNQDYIKPSSEAHWSDVANLSALYFSLFVNSLNPSWEKIPVELAALQSLARP